MNSPHVTIDKYSGKRYVISDIHGCYKTLTTLIEQKIKPSQSDLLFFLGDYINRGPSSAQVIDYFLQLRNQGYQVICLRGNHEENLLQIAKQYDQKTAAQIVRKLYKTFDLLTPSGVINQKYIDFFETLPYFIEMPDVYLVHGGFDYRKPKPFEDFSAMLNFYIDNTTYDITLLNGKRMIHGHRVTPLNKIQDMVRNRSSIISLDNGCVFVKEHRIHDVSKLGNLCCLEINQMKLYFQKNVDFQ
ncbi:MAG TPA: metallophosphoesterase family protein [Salinivirgaceae bacterium]|nr:metallophosphoesterase family protein [Salinivirgaceae bacterium]